METFRDALKRAHHVVFLTGAGISESGIPTFRGAGGLWRTYNVMDLACWEAFERDPALVWVVASCKPNPGHYAIADLQKRLREQGKTCTVITQNAHLKNIDGLHQQAGASVIEMHGSLWLVKEALKPHVDRYEDGVVFEERRVPICPALAGKGSPSSSDMRGTVPVDQLPHRDGKLLRPSVVWFGENLDSRVTAMISNELKQCDLFIIVGTSGTVYPGYAASLSRRKVPVAIFNLDPTPADNTCKWTFNGRSSELLPTALAEDDPVFPAVKDEDQ